VLKETILSGIVLAFMPRKPVPKPMPVHSPNAAAVAQVSAGMAQVHGKGDKPAEWPDLPPMDAAKMFYLEMQRSFPGEAIEMKWVRHTYDQFTRERGWPPLSDKALSMHLVSFGCRRIKVDHRGAGGGRVTAFEFPLQTAAQKRRKRDKPK
jgi:hypothetical protein